MNRKATLKKQKRKHLTKRKNKTYGIHTKEMRTETRLTLIFLIKQEMIHLE